MWFLPILTQSFRFFVGRPGSSQYVFICQAPWPWPGQVYKATTATSHQASAGQAGRQAGSLWSLQGTGVGFELLSSSALGLDLISFYFHRLCRSSVLCVNHALDRTASKTSRQWTQRLVPWPWLGCTVALVAGWRLSCPHGVTPCRSNSGQRVVALCQQDQAAGLLGGHSKQLS